MCYFIDTTNFIVNYFFEREEEMVNIKRLEEKKFEIESASKKKIYINLNRDSFTKTLYYYSDILSLNNDIIHCKVSNLNKHSQEDFNFKLPVELKEQYLALIRT